MTAVAERTWEAETAELLSELSSVQDAMLDVLVEKQRIMASSDWEQLVEVHAREHELCDRLEECHRRRRSLLDEAAGEGLPAASLNNLASAACGNSGKLGEQAKEVGSRMKLLRHHAVANWVLSQRTLLHLSQLLEIIATGGRMQPTYSKGAAACLPGALVDREA